MKKSVSPEERREVLKKGASLFGVSFCSAALSSIISGCETDTLKSTGKIVFIEISLEDGLSEIGGVIKKTFVNHNNGRAVFITRLGENDFNVMTSVCTHLGCEIDLPSEKVDILRCPCHKSEFSPKTGDVLHGPASAPLQTFSSSLEGKHLRITF